MDNLIIVLSILLLSLNLSASINFTPLDWDQFLDDHKVIYGEDNTTYAGDYHDQRFVEASKAVAVMIPTHQMIDYGTFYELKKNQSIIDQYPFCKNETSYRERVYSVCSGFLVNENILVTASHCISGKSICPKNHKWVFGHSRENIGSNEPIFVPKTNVYSCDEVLEIGSNPAFNVQKDYAVLKLDRSVHKVTPLKYRVSEKIDDDDELVLIGYPSGRPQVIADQGRIRNNTFFYFFRTNLDAFQGNSGAPVLNYRTGLVEGIFLSGESDYTLDEAKKCRKTKRCEGMDCRGEDVFRITGVDYIAPNKISWLSEFMF